MGNTTALQLQAQEHPQSSHTLFAHNPFIAFLLILPFPYLLLL